MRRDSENSRKSFTKRLEKFRVSIGLLNDVLAGEGKHFAEGKNAAVFSDLVNKLYSPTGALKQGRKQYGQLLSKFTQALDIPEVKMCDKHFSELVFSKVPSVCTKKFTKAFFNEMLKVKPSIDWQPLPRLLCRQNLRQAVLDQKVKSKQLYPHELVEILYNKRGKASSLEKEIYNAQWNDISNKE